MKRKLFLKTVEVIMRDLSAMTDELTWDRFTMEENKNEFQINVYGWINTPGKQRDFLLVIMQGTGKKHTALHTTSSAKWSEKISKILYDNPEHVPCKYVAELYQEFKKNN